MKRSILPFFVCGLLLSADTGCTQPNPNFCGNWISGCPDDTATATDSDGGSGSDSVGVTDGDTGSTGDPETTAPTTDPTMTGGTMSGTDGVTEGVTTTDGSTSGTTGDPPNMCDDHLGCELEMQQCTDGFCEACDVTKISCFELIQLYPEMEQPTRSCDEGGPNLTWEQFATLAVKIVPERFLDCFGDDEEFLRVAGYLTTNPELQAAWMSLDPKGEADLCLMQQIILHMKGLDTPFAELGSNQPLTDGFQTNQTAQGVLTARVCGVDKMHPLSGIGVLLADGVNTLCTNDLQAGDPNVMVVSEVGVAFMAPPVPVAGGQAYIPLNQPLTASDNLIVQVNTSGSTGTFCVQPQSMPGVLQWVEVTNPQAGMPLKTYQVYMP